jgi:hypothetical protein
MGVAMMVWAEDYRLKPCIRHKWLAVPEDESFTPKATTRKCANCGTEQKI